MVDKYTTAKQITQEYLNGDISELDFKRRISDVMDIPQQESKELHQIKSILNPKNKWTTKDGAEIDISKMSGHHLTSTIDWLERNAKKLHAEHIKFGYDTLNYVSGEMAEISIESELDNISGMDDIEFLRQYTLYEELLKEAERRGLRKNQ